MLYIYSSVSPHQWLTHVTSCWNTVIQCFQWFGTMLLLDTAFFLNVIIVHSVLLFSMIRAYCCCCSALELWGRFFGQNKHFLYVQVPGVDTVMDYYYWMVQHPTDQYTHLKVQEIHSCMPLAFFFFLSHPRVFSAHDFVKLPPFRNSYPGSPGTHSSPFPTTVLAFVLVAKRKRGQN